MKITNIKQQAKQGDRFSIFVDEKYSFSLGESELLASGLRNGQEITKEDLEALKGRAEQDKAYDRVLRYIAIRQRSRWELEQYLKRKNTPAPLTETILNKLSNKGYVDDVKFAEAWVANRRLLKPMSKRRLTQELGQKHVDGSIINKVLEEDETSDLSTLHQLVDKKRNRYKDDLKFMQYLARQGYNYQDIKEALQKTDDE